MLFFLYSQERERERERASAGHSSKFGSAVLPVCSCHEQKIEEVNMIKCSIVIV